MVPPELATIVYFGKRTPERCFHIIFLLLCFINDTHNSILVLYSYRISSDTHTYTGTDQANVEDIGVSVKQSQLPGQYPTDRSCIMILCLCVIPDCSMFSSVKPFEGQQFSALRKQCQQNKTLFEDPIFLPVDQSLFYQRNRIGKVTWKRPKV